jgi:8-oxo-dGTP pyrophosphatase MutT (NUDIX family)
MARAQVAAVCFSESEHGERRYLLIRTKRKSRTGNRWHFPKGKPKHGEELSLVAKREAAEEAGIAPELAELLGPQPFTTYQHFRRNGSVVEVAVVLLRFVDGGLSKQAERKAVWLSHEDALARLQKNRSEHEYAPLLEVLRRAEAYTPS